MSDQDLAGCPPDDRITTNPTATPEAVHDATRPATGRLELGPFFHAAPVLAATATPEGYLDELGGQWTEVLGWTEEELTSRPFVDFVHPDDRDATLSELAALNEGATTVGFVNRYATPDPERWVHLRWHSHVVEGEIFAVAWDVTREVAQEHELEARTRILEALGRFQQRAIETDLHEVQVEEVLDDLRLVTGAGEVLLATLTEDPDAAPALVALGATDGFLRTATGADAEGRPVFGDLNTMVGAVVRTGDAVICADPQGDPRRSPSPDRDPAVANLLGLPLPGRRGMVGVLALADLPGPPTAAEAQLLEPLCRTVGGVLEQLALRREADTVGREVNRLTTLFRAVIQDLDTCLFITGTDGTIEFLNPAAERLLGVRGDQVAGTLTPAAFVDPSDSAAYLAWIDGEHHGRVEWEFVAADGRRVPMLVGLSPLRDDIGRLEGWVHLCTELSAHREVEAERTRTAVLASEIDALRTRERELGLLAEATEYVMSSSGTRDALEVVRSYAPGILGHDDCQVLPVVLPRTARSARRHAAATPAPHPSEGPLGPEDCWALRVGRGHLTRSDQSTRCAHLPPGGSHVCVPLSDGERTVAVLSTPIDEGDASDTDEPRGRAAVGRVEDVARQMGVALSYLQLRSTLQQQATIDALTGVGNRRTAQQAVDAALAAHRLRGERFAVMILDVDRFKQVNDGLGHEAGDRVLNLVAEALEDNVRAQDTVARLGGDEFLVVLRGLGEDDTRRIGEFLRHTVEAHLADGPARCTASIGALYVEDATALDSGTLLGLADTALYRAKEEGRNRFRMAEPVREGAR
ncbi:MAG: diguanylate cyclase [Microthrixaceae bacterium]